MRAKYNFNRGASECGRRAFTLVELMVTMAIIALLATFLIASLYMAQQAARADRTRAMIARIDILLKQRWESYQWRPLPIDINDALASYNANKPGSAANLVATNTNDLAKARLCALRELQRLEMPSRWEDLNDPIYLRYRNGSNAWVNYRSAIAQRILDWHNAMRVAATNPLRGTDNGTAAAANYNQGNNSPAEFLYLILTTSMPGAPSARDQFAEHELGDIDKDGALEILDGWGNPIFFQRWAPGFTPQSDIQRNDPVNSHDPLDVRRRETDAYALFPLVWSRGPDGLSGIDIQNGHNFATNANGNNPFSNTSIGAPMASGNEVGRHFDNIHNHVLRSR